MHATVIRSTGSWYDVLTDDGQTFRCKVKGRFRLQGIRSTNPVCVGDGVTVVAAADGTAYITAIDPRRNVIVRRASNLSKQSHILAANLDQALLVCTVARPQTTTTFIDRFLASAEAYGVPVVIVFNKTDELSPEERVTLDELTKLYRTIDYAVFPISALTGEGVAALSSHLTAKLTLLAGHSGVGKTTLLNLLRPGTDARTAAVSRQFGTGMHTTTYSQRYDLPLGGALIDVPGVKGFGTLDFQQSEVSHYFRDIFRIAEHCRFRGCTHLHEPGCAVLRALDDGQLAPSRYASYLSILEDETEGKYREAE
ncbi:MAG: ribosome small subunit-dependent GTPase A [Alloprevotella sp.]|nr:ribosome small subunit-dependent GTPase A [Alloprevotella sp.]